MVGACGGAQRSDPPPQQAAGPAADGAELVRTRGCVSCHSVDGSGGAGPTLQGIWDSQVELADGSSVTVDRAYVARSLREPRAQIVEGFNGVMPAYDLERDEIDALVAYLRTLDAP